MDKMMKKALLVDDDFLVRTYLKMLPSWEKAGFDIVADVRDGEEALEVLDKESIELVVTDIAMPLVDGIELIKEIRKRYTGVYIIVLSCHDEFEYVKQAMKEGADEYVLKNTLNEESLYTLLVDADKKLGEKSGKEEKRQPVDKNKQMAGINKKFLFFNKVLAGTMTVEEREEERKRSGVRGKYQNSAVVLMRLEEFGDGKDPLEEVKKEQYCLEFLEKIYAGKKKDGEGPKAETEVIYLGNGNFCCFVDLSDIYKSSAMYQILMDVSSACYKLCQQEEYTYRIGVSNICIGSDALRQAYQQARLMIKMEFYSKDNISYYEVENEMGTELPMEARALLEQFDTIKHGNKKAEFEKLADAAVEAFEREKTESTLVLQWLKKIEHFLTEHLPEKKCMIHNIGQVRERLKEISEQLFECKRIDIPEKLNQSVRRAVEYTMRHYREGISLNDVAGAAGVNSTYLSYLFHQEMGIGFANYLLNLRIEYAKKLLRESNLKIVKISEQAGFNDYHYFSKVFKKTVGKSPARYRKEVEGKE